MNYDLLGGFQTLPGLHFIWLQFSINTLVLLCDLWSTLNCTYGLILFHSA